MTFPETGQFGALRVEAEDPGKPALALVHGFLSSRRHWLPNQDALREHFRLILVELPGHGDTPGCADASALTYDALVTALDSVRRALGLDRWFLCGQSFGATLTLRYGLAFPDHVAAQVWTNSNSAMRASADDGKRAAQERLTRLRSGGQDALRREAIHPRFARRFPEDIRTILSADADACDIATVLAILEHTMPLSSVRDRLAATLVPTLLVNGTYERSFQSSRAWAAEALPAMQVADLPGGHAINIENPAAFNAALTSFLLEHV